MEESEITGFILISMGTMLLMVLGLILLYRISKKQLIRQFQEKERLKEIHQKELLEAAINTQERERKRIASELHDHIGSNLQALKLFLHQIRTSDAEKIEKESTELLTHTIQDVKNLSHELMPASLINLGLQEALSTLCGRLDASGQISCILESIGNQRLEPQSELALYRIVQELSSNTLQHAKATEIKINLEVSESGFQLEYQDNGIGLMTQSDRVQKGLGLKTIESRCQMIGAEITQIQDDSQKGLKLKINR